jgi:hypothetical protein
MATLRAAAALSLATLCAASTSVALLVIAEYLSMRQPDLVVAIAKAPAMFFIAMVVVAAIGLPLFFLLRSALVASAPVTVIAGAAGGLATYLLIGLLFTLVRSGGFASLVSGLSLASSAVFAITGALVALVFVRVLRLVVEP